MKIATITSDIRIKGGYDKSGHPEPTKELLLHFGKIYTIVGNTGSGKSQLLEDIATSTKGDGITGRVVESLASNEGDHHIAWLSQSMNFVLDLSVGEFLTKRILMNETQADLADILACANDLCGESIEPNQVLTRLSGGQSRALMIADIAFNSKATMVLIDEIENAGIDKIKALNLLIHHDKLILVITHDPLLALYGDYRLVMEKGIIAKVIKKSDDDTLLSKQLYEEHLRSEKLRRLIRTGQERIVL